MVATTAPHVGKDITSKSTEVTKGKEIVDAQAHPEGRNKIISLEEGQEFSDFKIVDQLGKTLSKILILSLLLSSEAHMIALIKVLNVTHVMHDITIGQFDKFVANITAN